MGDSDGEYSVFEQQSNMLDKEEHCIEFEEEEIISEDDETEKECRVENTVSNGVASASKDLGSIICTCCSICKQRTDYWQWA